MQEHFNTLLGEIRSALRFRWLGLAIAAFLSIAGWTYVASRPNVYEASASFYLDTTSLLEQALQDEIIETDQESRIAFIRQSLFGTVELETVAQSVGLDSGAEDPIAREVMLNTMRRNIEFEALAPDRNQRSGDRIFELSYRNTDRAMATAVVEALVSTFIEGANDESRRDENEALRSIEGQIAISNAEAVRTERALADFKRENVNQLPSDQGEFQRRMRAAEQTLSEARRALNTLQSRLLADQREIENLERILPNSSAEIDPNSLPARLQAYQLEYDQKSQRLTSIHPEMVALRSSIANLTQQIESERRAAIAAGIDPNLVALEANPVYQEALIARADTERLIAERQAEIRDLEDEIARLDSQRDESLANEAAQEELERAADYARRQLETLLATKGTLERTMAVETSNPDTFRMINAPYAPILPVEPERVKLLLLVFAAALGAGGALCYGLAQLRPIFSSSGSLQQFAEFPVLGTVTNAWPVSERREVRKSFLAYSLVLSLLFVVLVGLAGIEMYGPGIHAPFLGD